MRNFGGVFGAAALLSNAVSAKTIPRADLAVRDNIAACEAVLIALKASAFCSTFVPIKDVTSSTTIGTPASTNVYVTAACTTPPNKRKARAVTTTTSTKTSASTITTKSTTTAQCSIKGVPTQVLSYACDVITQACIAFVTPKTTTTTYTASIVTKTITVTPTCNILPPPCTAGNSDLQNQGGCINGCYCGNSVEGASYCSDFNPHGSCKTSADCLPGEYCTNDGYITATYGGLSCVSYIGSNCGILGSLSKRDVIVNSFEARAVQVSRARSDWVKRS